ncbi:hypothetical protein GLYMA_12G008950v4 [Glycine max]|nr:hypothetical protein GLYMA_12G008950v4 [Glycine max]KAH1141011.1 hypothetical protein GYH30_032326 [Glycine max]
MWKVWRICITSICTIIKIARLFACRKQFVGIIDAVSIICNKLII